MKYAILSRNGRPLVLPKWQLAALLVSAISLGIAVAVVATGIFLIALPVVAVVVLGYRLFGGARRAARAPGGVIEGDYEVVENAKPPPRHEPR